MKKIFKKKGAKRVTAIALALVTLISTILAVPLSVGAASKEVTITYDYCYDTGGNIITYVKETTNDGYCVGVVGEELCRIYADGKDAYCIQPGHSLYSGDTLTQDASAAWNSLSKAQRKAINLALLFGKSGSSKDLVGTDGQKWIATQLMVWDFVSGCRDASTFKLNNSKFIDGITSGGANPNVKTNYNKIVEKLNNYKKMPSFAYGTYTVHQTKSLPGREYINDFDVFVCEDSKTYKYLINDAVFESYIKVVKVDAETGKAIKYSGAGFEIYNPKGEKVSMTFTYPIVFSKRL